jgi:hypothetical protein
MSHAGAAGAIYSTVEDLQRWNEGVFKNGILSRESLDAAFTRAETKASSDPADYGYGWAIGEQGGLSLVSHSGRVHGFASYLVRFPQQNLTIAVLHNSSPTYKFLNPSRITNRVARAYLKEEMITSADNPQKELIVDNTVNPKSYLEFKGDYHYGSLRVMKITTWNNHVFAQLTGQKEFEIFPASSANFFWKVVDAQAEFLFDRNGQVIAIKHTQNGRSFRAPKREEFKIVEVAPDALNRYIGVYEFDNIGTFTISRKNNHLVVYVPSLFGIPGNKLDIYGKSEALFFTPKLHKIEIEFIKNKSGKVDNAVIHEGKSKYDGIRIE